MMRPSIGLSLALCLGVVACGGKDDTGDTSSDGTTTDATDCTLSGVYTEDITLGPADCPEGVVLSGGVFIGDPASADNTNTITFEAGTIVYGDNASKGFLSIQRGARINAVGTADAPIVFTSPLPEGSRARSDWGGIIINGKAPINPCSDGTAPAAGCTSESEGDAGTYGGDNPADNSGTMKYVRIEFGGIEITPENEVNGLALAGVGSGTSLSYIQVHMNKDDGVEFFGGTASIDHLVITGAGDDSLDWTEGWTGSADFVCINQAADIGDRGFEADNFDDENNALPRSAPDISNATVITPGADRTALTFRRGTGGNFSNFVVAGFKSCIDIDSDATFDQMDGGGLTMTNSMVACATNFKVDSGEDAEPRDADIEAWFTGQAGNMAAASADLEPNSWVPTSGGNVASAGIGCVQGDDWTAGWTTSALN